MKEYYKTAELWLPKYPRWRMFKFKLFNNKIIQFPSVIVSNNISNICRFPKQERIRDIETLRKLLMFYEPKHVWFSVSGWLNPREVRGSEETEFWNIRLFRDLPIDIDAKGVKKDEIPTIEQLEEAWQRTKYVMEYLKKDLGEPTYTIFSGNKGFHLYYEHSTAVSNFLKEKKYKEIEDLIDVPITDDEYRVVRLPLTINGTTGYRAFFINPKDLNKSAASLLEYNNSHVPYLNKESPMNLLRSASCQQKLTTTSSKGNDVVGKQANKHKSRQVTGLGRTEPAIVYYITNKISGTKKFVLVLRYKNNWQTIKRELCELQETYDIGNVYVLNYGTEIGVVGLKAHDLRRLEKIYRASSSINKNYFFKKKLSLIPFAEGHYEEGKLKISKYQALMYVKLTEDIKFNINSNPHKIFLSKMGFKVREQDNFIGKENLVYESWKEDR